ncbi:MAG: glycosyltransferase [Actinomycetota bacterium]|nr:glycosyltransferase [Actinomycetota bacterium]
MVEAVFVSPLGNVFMREIAEHIAEGLRAHGHHPTIVTDELPGGTDPFANLVVAPHEFFGLFPATPAERMKAAAQAVSINTEQPGTPFFDVALPYLCESPAALDINPLALAELQRLGLNAAHLPLGVVPSMCHWDGGDTPRSIDLALLAGRTPRRELFVGGAASVLWEWNTDLRFFSWHKPATGDRPQFVHGDEKYRRLADTRVLLNVHRDEVLYFEWARVLDALANGCVVATEHSVGIGPLVPGEHLLVAGFDDLAERAVALLFDEPRRLEMARAARHLATTQLDQGVLAVQALEQVRSAGGGTAARRHRSTARTHAAGDGVVGKVRRLLAEDDTPRRELLVENAAVLKRAWLGQLGTVRALERAAAALQHGAADHVDRHSTAAYTATTPDVTVVVPLYQQGDYIGDALASVAAASGSRLAVETVIVDDHSPDDSAEVVLAYMAANPWQPITLLRRAANGGLPVARNTGFAAARGRYVFALDADNLLRPNGLRVLAAHLDAAPAEVVAAYGLLERFDETGPVGLTSHLPWDPDLLVHGAFIDAMAMWRKDAWEALGGYADDLGIYGWEDYDLWLTTAEHGSRADLVPRLVGRYREQGGSMRKVSDVDMASNFERLRLRHPRLAWPS